MNSIFGRKNQRRSARSRKSILAEHHRQLSSESLESRVLLAGDTMAWHNADLPMDTTRDGSITSRDALLIVNDLNANGPRDVDADIMPSGMLDVTGDGVVSSRDALTIINYLNRPAGEGDMKVQIRLEVTSAESTDVITEIGPNEEFVLRAFVTDLREAAEGVFGAYLDVTYNAELADTVGAVNHEGFGNGTSSDLTVDGILDEVGGFSSNTGQGTGAAETPLFSITLTTEDALGTLTFSPDPADLIPVHEVTLFGIDDPVLDDEIMFVGTSLQIVSDVMPPTAVDDTLTVEQDGTIFLAAPGLLENDLNPGGGTLTATISSDPQNGTASVFENGAVQYTPSEGFSGTDTFTYTVTDGTQTDTGTVSVTITPIALLEAVDDTLTVDQDDTVFLAAPGLLENDLNPGGGTLTASLSTDPQNGTASVSENGAVQYTPSAGFSGTDTFTYTVTDGTQTDTGTVTVTVIPVVVEGPVAVDDVYTTPFETTLVTTSVDGVLANDTDADSEVIFATLIEPTINGTVELATDGSFTYIPDAGFSGADSFIYEVSDGTTSDQANAVINVLEDTSDGALVSFRVAVTDAQGATLTSLDSGDAFELRVYVDDISPEPQQGVFAAYTDVEWNPGLAEVTGPIVFSGIYPNGRSGDASVGGLLNEVGAFDGLDGLGGEERLLFSVPLQATGGGQLTFSTNPADNLPFGDVLLFVTIDDAVDSSLINYGSTTVTVTGRTEPVAINDEGYETDGAALIVSAENGVLANDLPVADETLTAMLVDDVRNGTLTLMSDGSFTYLPNAGFVGADTFTYRALSDEASSNLATVTITVGDPSPSSLSGVVYFDLNNNGERDAGEHGFGGTTIHLSGADVFGNTISLSTQTSASGSYNFGNLTAGDYTLAQIQPGIVIDGIDSRAGVTSSTNDRFQLALPSGTDLDGVNFGERGLQSPYFGNPIFFASAPRGGASVAIADDGSWFCLDAGWGSIRSVSASLAGNFVILSAVNLDGTQQQVQVPVSNSNVRVIGNDANGYLVRLTDSSAAYGLTAVGSAAAVDAAFAE